MSLTRKVVVVAVLAALTAAGSVTTATDNPPNDFQLRGVATWDSVFNGFTPDGATFDGVALTSHLGKVSQSGDLFFLAPPDAQGLAPGLGTVTLTAANGDQLDFTYSGVLDANTGIGTGPITFTGGTGRFSNATGTGSFVAVIDLGVPSGNNMDVTIEGNLRLKSSD